MQREKERDRSVLFLMQYLRVQQCMATYGAATCMPFEKSLLRSTRTSILTSSLMKNLKRWGKRYNYQACAKKKKTKTKDKKKEKTFTFVFHICSHSFAHVSLLFPRVTFYQMEDEDEERRGGEEAISTKERETED